MRCSISTHLLGGSALQPGIDPFPVPMAAELQGGPAHLAQT